MPVYNYLCSECNTSLEEWHEISDPHPSGCPQCNEPYGMGFQQNYSLFNVTGTVYGDPKTVGQQAELNAKRMGSERMQMLWENERKSKRGFDGKLSPDAKPLKVDDKLPFFRDGSTPGVPKLDKPLDVSKLDSKEKTEKYIMTGEL